MPEKRLAELRKGEGSELDAHPPAPDRRVRILIAIAAFLTVVLIAWSIRPLP